eukprot:4026060-Lingulodinium_polyedra.AAC.1
MLAHDSMPGAGPAGACCGGASSCGSGGSARPAARGPPNRPCHHAGARQPQGHGPGTRGRART